MSNKFGLSDEDLALFKQSIGTVKTLLQDTVLHQPQRKTQPKQKQAAEVNNTEFYFSDDYHPVLQQDPLRYLREDGDAYELKKLRRGDYPPELFLDLHGLTQLQAKKEIAALIQACLDEHVFCASIMYGHGKNILKNQTPRWLAQHPNILAFCQAPKMYGGSAALLLLLDNLHEQAARRE